MKQLVQQRTAAAESEKLRRLRINAEAQEAKLADIQTLREKLDVKRFVNFMFTI